MPARRLPEDHYAGASEGWALGASHVYAPISRSLVDMFPGPLHDLRVLDVGAGTGLASAYLVERGAWPLAVDLSADMLAWQRDFRPPAAVADTRALPFPDGAMDGCVAAFVLNHLEDPLAGFGELARVVRPGGSILACVFSNSNQSDARDAVDAVATGMGWRRPDWYVRLVECAAPLLGTVEDMRSVALAAGLVAVTVDERRVDVGVTEPEQLVDYRLGQANFRAWLDEIGPDAAAELRARAIAAASPLMAPYEPGVVFLSAEVAPV